MQGFISMVTLQQRLGGQRFPGLMRSSPCSMVRLVTNFLPGACKDGSWGQGSKVFIRHRGKGVENPDSAAGLPEPTFQLYHIHCMTWASYLSFLCFLHHCAPSRPERAMLTSKDRVAPVKDFVPLGKFVSQGSLQESRSLQHLPLSLRFKMHIRLLKAAGSPVLKGPA